MRVCVCAIDIGSILQSPWLLHLPARYCGVPVSLYEQQNYLYDYCPRMLLLVVLVGFSLRWLIGAAIEARPRPLSGTQPPLSLSLSHTHTHIHSHTHVLRLSLTIDAHALLIRDRSSTSTSTESLTPCVSIAFPLSPRSCSGLSHVPLGLMAHASALIASTNQHRSYIYICVCISQLVRAPISFNRNHVTCKQNQESVD